MQSMRTLFDELVDLPRPEQLKRIEHLSLEPDEQRTLLAMLDADSHRTNLLDTPIDRAIEALRDEDEQLLNDLVGTRIGAFRILELVGQGGSAAVFRAERPAGLGVQVVALKLLQTGLYSPDAQRRFLREQAILAQLTHPDIARLVEGGVSEAGIPYIAMEFVNGTPVTRAADERRWDLRARLIVFLRLCRAVQAAHAALVVHCDLKPSNVLVDQSGALKVLDFGIGRLLGDDIEHKHTAIALTPEYAAPEQFVRGTPAVTYDVHALGVMLAELVTGKRLRGGQLPSQAWRDGLDEPPPGMPPRRRLEQLLRGDFDAIVATALADDPAKRYPSAEALARDVERFMDDQPIRARTYSRRELVGKFVRRHRVAALVFALLTTALIVSTAFATVQTIAARREAEAARAAESRARSIQALMVDAFSEAAPQKAGSGQATVKDAMERSLASITTRTDLDPVARVQVKTTLGRVLFSQGDFARSADLFRDARGEALRYLPPDDPEILWIDFHLAKILAEIGDWPESRTAFDALMLRIPPKEAELWAQVLTTSGWLAGRMRDRERALDESARAVQAARALGDNRAIEQALRSRGSALLLFQPGQEAIEVYENLLARQRAQYGEQHARVAAEYAGLSRAYRMVGRLDDAERAARAAIAINEDIYDEEHWLQATHINALSMVQRYRRDFHGLILSTIEQQRIQKATQKEDHPDLLGTWNSISNGYANLGEWEEAERWSREGVEKTLKFGQGATFLGLRMRGSHAYILARLGRVDEGRAVLSAAFADLPQNGLEEVRAELSERGARIAMDTGDMAAAEPYTQALLDLAELPAANGTMKVTAPLVRAEWLVRESRYEDALPLIAKARAGVDDAAFSDHVPRTMLDLVEAEALQGLGNARAAAMRDKAARSYAALKFPPAQVVRSAQALGLTPRE